MRNHIIFSLLFLPACSLQTQDKIPGYISLDGNNEIQTIADIPLPEGYTKMIVAENSFANWLRNIKLKKDKRVFLYNGTLKPDQSVQYAVLDEKKGNMDLQQCADAIMRLRAEYYFSKNKYDSIHFEATDGTVLSFVNWRRGQRYYLSGNKLITTFIKNSSSDIIADFENYLQIVFTYAGTYSLAAELKQQPDINELKAGDVFIKPGFPGHAMIVADVCMNKEGKKMFMLAQGYMPAQDMHIVKNPWREELSPWYEIPDADKIITPSWVFTSGQLKQWK